MRQSTAFPSYIITILNPTISPSAFVLEDYQSPTNHQHINNQATIITTAFLLAIYQTYLHSGST